MLGEQEVSVRLQNARDVLTNWETHNPILLEGELALVYDINNEGEIFCKVKIGDGETAFNDLPYLTDPDALSKALLGKPNGIATLGKDGKIPISQLPTDLSSGIPVPSLEKDNTVYFDYGETLEPWNEVNTDEIEVTGTTSVTLPGEYSTTFTLQDDNAHWKRGDDAPLSISWEAKWRNADSKQLSAEEFHACISCGHGPDLFTVGDIVTLYYDGTVGSNQFLPENPRWAQILGFNHNQPTEGTGNYVDLEVGVILKDGVTANIAYVENSRYNQIVTVSYAYGMNTSATNVGGFKSSSMSSYICFTAFYNAIVDEWRQYIVRAKKYTDNVGGATNTEDCVTGWLHRTWLLAEYEIFGQNYMANHAEAEYQKQYELYKNGISRIRYGQSDFTNPVYWWLRSPYASNSAGFCYITPAGKIGGTNANYSLGFSPCFRIA